MPNGRYVYVIKGDHDRVKIGMTDRPMKRLAELQTGNPFALRFAFVGEVDNVASDIEVYAHDKLDAHRESGEWFNVPVEAAIAAVMGSAYHLGHAITPVDPYNLPAWSGKKPWWKIGASGISLAVFIYVCFYATDNHVLTAFIAMGLSYGVAWLVLRSVAMMLLNFQTARR